MASPDSEYKVVSFSYPIAGSTPSDWEITSTNSGAATALLYSSTGSRLFTGGYEKDSVLPQVTAVISG